MSIDIQELERQFHTALRQAEPGVEVPIPPELYVHWEAVRMEKLRPVIEAQRRRAALHYAEIKDMVIF